MLCGMASAVGDATGCDDSGTDSPCLFSSGDDNFWKELSGLTGGPLHSLVDRLHRVIMLDKVPSTAKAYIAAFKQWHCWATELKLSTLPAKAPHVALFLLHLSQETPHGQPRHSQSPHYGRCTKKPASPTRPATLQSNSYAKPCVAFIVDQSTPNRHSALCSSRKSFHAWCVTAHPWQFR